MGVPAASSLFYITASAGTQQGGVTQTSLKHKPQTQLSTGIQFNELPPDQPTLPSSATAYQLLTVHFFLFIPVSSFELISCLQLPVISKE